MEDPETLTDCIDYNILGSKKKKKLRLTPTSFIAGYLQLLIRSTDYKEASQAIKERVRHLSFLVHLFCRYDDFDAVFHEYKIVQVSKTHPGITGIYVTEHLIKFFFSSRLISRTMLLIGQIMNTSGDGKIKLSPRSTQMMLITLTMRCQTSMRNIIL